MTNFRFHNPTKILFGRGQVANLTHELKSAGLSGKKAMLVSGGGSVKRNGSYDDTRKALEAAGVEVIDFTGVEPNPRHATINRGVTTCREQGIEFVVAVGGGSTIDAAKGIAATVPSDTDDVWDIVSSGKFVEEGRALPVVVVLTNAATGSEMDAWAVISNMDTNEKLSLGGPGLFPTVSVEDPSYTTSLPAFQTACGSFDIFNHVLDNYYLSVDDPLDLVVSMQEAVMRTVVKWAPVAVAEPDNYEARANLMWASSMAVNTILDGGTQHTPFNHAIEHEVSAYYDVTHGLGLAAITPRWLEHITNEQTAPIIAQLGIRVFGVPADLSAMEAAHATAKAVESWAHDDLGLNLSLAEAGVDETHIHEMASHACNAWGTDGALRGIYDLTVEDVEQILRASL